MTTVKNRNLTAAKKAKKDEFYTLISDIEKELKHYRDHFKDKVVFCNCDDPEESNFWKFFSLNFEFLGLKKLISTHYRDDGKSYKMEIVQDINGDGKINGLDVIKTPLKENGDFRSPESVALLKEADIVVTNPPFSLFREYIAQLMEHKKKFIVLGNMNAITYKEIFPYIMNNELWFGPSISSGDREFMVPSDYPLNAAGCRVDDDGNKYIRVKGVRWFTNLETQKRNEELLLWKSYKGNEADYPKYDNYDAINVNKVVDIPTDYEGAMGVPITFLDKYNPDQFEILGIDRQLTLRDNGKTTRFFIKSKEIYARIVIRRKKS